MDLMEKVRQVGENYELNKYKALNKTVELDARLANDRLLATKLRLSQVCSLNDKLSKQVRLVQQQYTTQEKKLLLAETMLRQLIDNRGGDVAVGRHHKGASAGTKQGGSSGGRLSRLRSRSSKTTATANASSNTDTTGKLAAAASERGTDGGGGGISSSTANKATSSGAEQATTATSGQQAESGATGKEQRAVVSNSGTQTQRSRAKTIISDLRQRLNFVGSKGECHRSGLSKKRPASGGPASLFVLLPLLRTDLVGLQGES